MWPLRIGWLLAAVLSVAIAGCGDTGGEPPAEPTPTTSASPEALPETTTTVAPTTAAPPSTAAPASTESPRSVEAGDLAIGWSFEFLDLPYPARNEPPGLDADAVSALASSDLGMVAIGKLDDWITPVFREPIVWHSLNGGTWERVGQEVFVTAELWDVVAGGPGFVAVGSDCSIPDLTRCAAAPAVWVSPDGVVWQRVPHDPSVFPGCLDQGDLSVNSYLEGQFARCSSGGERPEMTDVSVGDGGLVAIGYDATWTMLWHSADGVTWTRVGSEVRPEYPMVDGHGWWLYADYAGAWTRAGLIQPGLRCIDGSENEKCSNTCFGYLWRSEKGSEWSAEALPDGVAEWWPTVVVEGAAGIVVLGDRQSDCTFCWAEFDLGVPSIVAFHSSDGVHWTESTPSLGVGRTGPAVATPVGFVATVEEQWFPVLVSMWFSADGLSWQQVPDIDNQPEGLWVQSLTWDGDGLLLLASAPRDGDQALVMGRWTPP